jgi:hypothetical protein
MLQEGAGGLVCGTGQPRTGLDRPYHRDKLLASQGTCIMPSVYDIVAMGIVYIYSCRIIPPPSCPPHHSVFDFR